jgi:hypothetical protein
MTIPKSIFLVVALAGAARTPDQIDPEAISAIEKMSAFLRQQQSFDVRTSTYNDYELANGMTVRLWRQGDLRVRRPDHLRANVESDQRERQYFYDGKTFTIYAPRLGYYAQVAAPPTIRALADQLEDRYGLELPLVDLFRLGSDDDSSMQKITAAVRVGQTTIDGVVVDQYAFRQPGLDWQIWIQRGPQPLPVRLVLTTTDDPSRPQHGITMKWNLNTRHEDAVFAFQPPKDTNKIVLAELGGKARTK